MKTRQKIIQQAIEQYNTHGVRNVTSRDLAKVLGISHGNLEYHFPNKESLLKAIYQQMRKDISEVYLEREASADALLHFNELLLRLEVFHDKYLFFNLDVLEISRNFNEVESLLKSTFQIRKEQMTHFFRRFKEQGYFKEEPVEGAYMRLQHTIRILITFWKSQQEILPFFVLGDNEHMATYIWELLIPHMTPKGLAEYAEQINPDFENA